MSGFLIHKTVPRKSSLLPPASVFPSRFEAARHPPKHVKVSDALSNFVKHVAAHVIDALFEGGSYNTPELHTHVFSDKSFPIYKFPDYIQSRLLLLGVCANAYP